MQQEDASEGSRRYPRRSAGARGVLLDAREPMDNESATPEANRYGGRAEMLGNVAVVPSSGREQDDPCADGTTAPVIPFMGDGEKATALRLGESHVRGPAHRQFS
jgi:hypothetical protein